MSQHTVENSRAFSRRVILPLVGLVVMLLACAVGGLFWTADYQTRVAIAQQARLAMGALRIQADKLAVSANDYGYWDDAVAALVDAPDYDWMRDNIGSGASKSLGTEMAFVIDASGRTIFSYLDQTDSTPQTIVPLPADFQRSYDAWRRRTVGDSFAGLQPFADTAVAIAIAPVRSSTDAKRPPTGYAVVFVQVVDKQLMTELSHDFELANFRVVRAEADISDTRAQITLGEPGESTEPGDSNEPGALAGERSPPPVRFAWDPQRPGSELLQVALPFIFVFLATLALLALVVLRHFMTAAHIIQDRDALANRDTLTGLANRGRFFVELDRALARIEPGRTGTAVMYIDLDGFKRINDTLGHAAGDELLIQAAERFKSCLTDADLVARIGGDEFAVIMSGQMTRADIQARAASIVLSLAQPFELSAATVQIACSVGIAECWQKDTSSIEVLNRADQALYQVKASGKNSLRFADDPVAQAPAHDALKVA